MIIGIHPHVFSETLNNEKLDNLDSISAIGFNSVDINIRKLGIQYTKSIRKRVNKLGLIIKENYGELL